MDCKINSFLLLIILSICIQCTSDLNNSSHLSTDFSMPGEFTSGIEGPAADGKGNIYVVNYNKQGTIGKVISNGESSLFVELPTGSIGNGIRINGSGNLLIADYTNHNVLEVHMTTKAITVYTHNDQMNQPNDLAIMDNGILFASDPNWKESTGNLWRVNLDQTTTLLEENMGTTNGVEVSPDQKRLYVNESVQRKVWVYDLSTEGAVQNKRLFYEFPDFGMDGMRTDIRGNLYITRHGKGTVAILSPEGKLIKEVELIGTKPSNITFGGADGKTCYVTVQDRGCLESFSALDRGREWKK